MINLKNKKIDEWGRVIYTEEGIYEKLYNNDSIDDLIAEINENVEKYNQYTKYFDNSFPTLKTPQEIEIPAHDFHKILQENWFIPEKYKNLDILNYVLSKCDSDIEKDRILKEYDLFKERNMENLLKFLIYLVDTMRENNIVWGVGRGSSVSSYLLYKIGVHKINSLKYNLDISEFLR